MPGARLRRTALLLLLLLRVQERWDRLCMLGRCGRCKCTSGQGWLRRSVCWSCVMNLAGRATAALLLPRVPAASCTNRTTLLRTVW